MRARHWPWHWLTAALIAAAGCRKAESPAAAGNPARTQTNAAAQPAVQPELFHQSFYYPPPNHQHRKMDLTATQVAPLPTGGRLQTTGLHVESYSLADELQLVMEAPEAELTPNPFRVESAGLLKLRTGDGGLTVQGTGFNILQASNLTVIISNDVVTTVREELLEPGAVTNRPAGRLTIHADHFDFDQEGNRVVYTGHVRADDEQVEVTCDTAELHVLPKGGIKDLEADGNVVVAARNGTGRAYADHAVYTAGAGPQMVTMTGNPHWDDGPRHAVAERFILINDRAQRTLRAENRARFTLPHEALSGPGLLLTTGPAATNTSAGGAPATLDADVITLQLPLTNGPVQGMVAEGHVVVLDPQTESRATGERAIYRESSGTIELIGHADWQSRLREARGEWLGFNRSNQVFSARTNAFLRFPPESAGRFMALGNAVTNAGALMVEITSRNYEYANEVLTFRDQVHGELKDGDRLAGVLDCGGVTARFHSNVLQRLVAETDVRARQLPTPPVNGRSAEGEFQCDRAEINWRTNGLLSDAHAAGRIQASRTQITAGGPKPPQKFTLSAGVADATFLPGTNQVDVATAEHDVVITGNEKRGTGAKLTYTSTNDTFVLTGSPRVEMPLGWDTGSEAIVYDHAKGQFYDRGGGELSYTIPANTLALSSTNTNAPKARRRNQ